ncbi:hypothetical protein ACSTI9_00780, partial [Vibrio parahaemolyticus]
FQAVVGEQHRCDNARGYAQPEDGTPEGPRGAITFKVNGLQRLSAVALQSEAEGAHGKCQNDRPE